MQEEDFKKLDVDENGYLYDDNDLSKIALLENSDQKYCDYDMKYPSEFFEKINKKTPYEPSFLFSWQNKSSKLIHKYLQLVDFEERKLAYLLIIYSIVIVLIGISVSLFL